MKLRYLIFFCLLGLILVPTSIALAQEVKYIPITTIPFIEAKTTPTAEAFVTALYRMSITVAAALAFVKIIYGGVQWMLTDVVTSKEQAKKDINGAIIGLVIVLSAVLILEVINPQLKTLNLFSSAPAINIGTPASKPAVQPTQ